MKISREARQEARRIYRAASKEGALDTEKILAAIRYLLTQRPHGYLAIVHRLKTLVQFEVNRRTYSVQSAIALPDDGASVFRQLEQRFGPPLAKNYRVNSQLIGGLRIQVGSDVWDGSIRQKLRLINPTLN